MGTEEETGGDGAREVSTGVEKANLVRRRRAVVTRPLLLLDGGSRQCFATANSSQGRMPELLAKAFDESILCSE